MKFRLKGHHFDTIEEIHTQTQNVIDTLTFENFLGCMKSWETRWDRCTHAQRDYFEGENGKLKVTVRNFFLMVKFPELLGSPKYKEDTVLMAIWYNLACHHFF
jgi:hypothetical protein